MLEPAWASLTDEGRSNYTWQGDGIRNEVLWQFVYRKILSANIVLDNIDKIAFNNESEESWKLVKGSAYFFRAWYFFEIAQIWSAPYNRTTSSTLPGIPLRLGSDLYEPVRKHTSR